MGDPNGVGGREQLGEISWKDGKGRPHGIIGLSMTLVTRQLKCHVTDIIMCYPII